MTPEQFAKIEETITHTVQTSVQLYVNGKIDRMDGKIDTLNMRLDNYIESDNLWKQGAQPTIEMGNNVRGFGKVFVYILGIVAAIGGAVKGLELLMRK